MKTEVLIERRIKDVLFHQSSVDGFFNATELAVSTGDKFASRPLNHFLESNNVIEFIKVLDADSKLKPFSEKSEKTDNQIVTNTENRGEIKIELRKNPTISDVASVFPSVVRVKRGNRTKGIPDQVYMKPELFLKFAMWLNPEFELATIRFIMDKLVEFRNDLGDYHITFTNAINKVCNGEVNWDVFFVVFNSMCLGREHTKGVRQTLNEAEAKYMLEQQKNIVFAINNGLIINKGQLWKVMTNIRPLN